MVIIDICSGDMEGKLSAVNSGILGFAIESLRHLNRGVANLIADMLP